MFEKRVSLDDADQQVMSYLTRLVQLLNSDPELIKPNSIENMRIWLQEHDIDVEVVVARIEVMIAEYGEHLACLEATPETVRR